MKTFATLVLLLLSANAFSCKCGPISSIEETINSQPLLVEGLVVNAERAPFIGYGTVTLSVTLRVNEVLKGIVKSDTVTVTIEGMCYMSLEPKRMEIGHTYVLPLSGPDVTGRYQLAGGCAHSGMEIISGKLYTFEPTQSVDGRRLLFYRNYSEFRRLLKK